MNNHNGNREEERGRTNMLTLSLDDCTTLQDLISESNEDIDNMDKGVLVKKYSRMKQKLEDEIWQLKKDKNNLTELNEAVKEQLAEATSIAQQLKLDIINLKAENTQKDNLVRELAKVIERNVRSDRIDLENEASSLLKVVTGRIEWEDRVYEGGILNNKKSGYGVIRFKSGQEQRGSFINDMKHGQFTTFWPNSDRADTTFVQGKENGVRRMVLQSGDFILTEYKNDLKHGNQLIVSPSEQTVLHREFKEGKQQGRVSRFEFAGLEEEEGKDSKLFKSFI